jgi:predicted TIM-barrel fold metal-dependent hydrolase
VQRHRVAQADEIPATGGLIVDVGGVDHVRLTTQPIEEPPNAGDLAQVLAMMAADRTVMFSSDYPHWDNDDPRRILRRVDAATRERIFGGTAAELYGLDDVPDRATVTPPRERGRAPEGTVSGTVE